MPLAVRFSILASEQCRRKQAQWNTDVRQLVEQVLRQDPRPSYQQGRENGRVYAMRLYDFDLRWRYVADGIEVLELADS